MVLAISVATYATHTRAHYDGVDQLLVSAARHVASEDVGSLAPNQLRQVIEVPAGAGVVTRLYSPAGVLLDASPVLSAAPALEPGPALRRPSDVPFDPIAGLAPPMVYTDAGPGIFADGRGADGERWRIYVLPLAPSGRYLELAASMGGVDASVTRLRLLLVVLGPVGTLAAFLVAWLLAGRALHPVRSIIATARGIARSRGFSSRVPVPPQADELGELARTFNEMLESLEIAYRSQQRFVADASHELRAPLTAIRANLELLAEQPRMSATDREVAIAEAGREAERLSRLVADLLVLARADAGVGLQKQPVELDRLVLETVREVRRIAGDRRLEIEGLDPAMVTGDVDRLKQLLLILLDNAIKYSLAGGRVGLRLQRSGSEVELRIRDSGVGIAPADLAHVYERFYRADPARARDPGGTGLGLPIARWIIEQHEGEIDLVSELGRGTEAIVRLPAWPGGPDPGSAG